MEFTNEFTVPVPIGRAFEVLTDLETVAPCMPGATLDSVDGDTYQGHIKVKVGPMSLTYHGTARLVDVDPEAHSAGIEAKGQDQRGGGTATADVTATMESLGDSETRVIVTTDINVTGRPAQFGRGVMADVGAKIIDKFSDCLVGELTKQEPSSDPTPTPAEGESLPADANVVEDADLSMPEEVEEVAAPGDATLTPAAAGADATEPRRPAFNPPKEEALDLLEVAGGATAKRLLPVAVLAAIALIVWLVRRDGDGGDEE